MEKLEKAIELAKKYHEGQKRKDGSDYINHPLRVMEFLKKYDFPEELLVAGVLHDMCEDTDITISQINEMFGTRIGFIINALSKNRKPKNHKELKKEYEEKKNKRKISNLENYENFDEYVDYRFHIYLNRLYMGIIAEPRIMFIKIADQIDNLSDMKPFSKEKKLRKINEVEQYFLPMYERCESLFSINEDNLKMYKTFISLLKSTIEKAKKDI